jgi:hypothetical protein
MAHGLPQLIEENIQLLIAIDALRLEGESHIRRCGEYFRTGQEAVAVWNYEFDRLKSFTAQRFLHGSNFRYSID